jgi:hypothetical protein
MIVFGEGRLYRHLQNFINYYHRSRTHLDWRRTAGGPDRSNHQALDGSSRFRRWVGSIIVTSGAPPNTREFPTAGPAHLFNMSEACAFGS